MFKSTVYNKHQNIKCETFEKLWGKYREVKQQANNSMKVCDVKNTSYFGNKHHDNNIEKSHRKQCNEYLLVQLANGQYSVYRVCSGLTDKKSECLNKISD